MKNLFPHSNTPKLQPPSLEFFIKSIDQQRKYEELASKAAGNGWRFEKLIVEVGARGFVPSYVRKALTRLDIKAKALTNKLALLAQKCSYVIWINRFNKEFQTWRL